MIMRGKKILSKKMWQIIVLTIVLFVSDDTLMFGINGDPRFSTVKHIVIISLLVVMLVRLFPRLTCNESFPLILTCCVLCFLVLLTAIINDDLRQGYFYKFVILLISCVVVNFINLEDFARHYDKIMYLLALISVVCMIIASINLNAFSIFPVFYNSANATFYNAFIWYVPTTGRLMRNYGIFREPGVYQMFLIYALLINLNVLKKLNLLHLAVYVLALFFTYSTTGYVAFLFFVVLFLIRQQKEVDKRKKYMLIVLFGIALFFVAKNTDLLSMDGAVFNKFSNEKGNSTVARYASVFANFRIWKSAPVFGAGLTNVDSMFPILSLNLFGKISNHNTNTIMCELATFGIIYATIFIVGYLRFAKRIAKNNFEFALIFAMFLILSCGERLSYSPITYILMFYGFDSARQIKKQAIDDRSFAEYENTMDS